MSEHCIIRADFSASRTVAGRKCLQLIFEVPIEAADDTMAKLGGFPQPGSNRWCAIALLNETAAVQGGEVAVPRPVNAAIGVREDLDSASTSSSEPASGSPKKPWSEYTRSQQAAILCADPYFWRYFIGEREQKSAAICTLKLREHFRMESRTELDEPENHGRWDEFVAIWNMNRDRFK